MIQKVSDCATTQIVFFLALLRYKVYLLLMNINEYINSFPDKVKARCDLAEAIGYEEVTVRSWANGNRHPGRKIWPAIEIATDGKVTTADLAALPITTSSA